MERFTHDRLSSHGYRVLANLHSLAMAEGCVSAGRKARRSAEKEALFSDAQAYLDGAIRTVDEWQLVGVEIPEDVLKRINALGGILSPAPSNRGP